ncbi:hypothetical protein CERSUDRAFT_114922 [Gelatoporia subvermispora B]|uniref:Uncharacterized protein n=1 Tax=Ceriporiopsis subvermispora (strain B) TaxID=914234 RepID=M2RDZ0_CERS8|nr:hypothetical protein CERSUDRAFT_114922 [Gelatoporia subvermispora B]
MIPSFVWMHDRSSRSQVPISHLSRWTSSLSRMGSDMSIGDCDEARNWRRTASWSFFVALSGQRYHSYGHLCSRSLGLDIVHKSTYTWKRSNGLWDPRLDSLLIALFSEAPRTLCPAPWFLTHY